MFQNLKVLELASVLAGPGVGQFFAELGAEVIKVENPGTHGDVTRSWKAAAEITDDRSAYFCSVNWGKRSLALDLAKPEAVAVIHQLVRETDIVISSYKSGDAEKLGVSYEKLAALNPTLIYGQISGYGAGSDRVGYDAVIQAESGFMDLNGTQESGPLKMPVALIDVLAGHHLKEALLLALLKKERTGKGGRVEVSLLDAAVASLVNQASNWLVGKTLPGRQGSLHPNIAPYGETFTTSDGKTLILAIGTDRQFQDLCGVLGMDAASEMFFTNQMRVRNRLHLQKKLAVLIAQRNADDLMRSIHQKKIPAGLVRNLEEVLDSPEIKPMTVQADGIVGVRSFVAKSGDRWMADVKLTAPPKLGEYNQIV